MDISLQAEVVCQDGTRGRLECIILNPINDRITHLAIGTGGLVGQAYLVPLAFVRHSSPERIELTCTSAELVEMEPFVRTHFIGPKDPEYDSYLASELAYDPAGSLLWPYVPADPRAINLGEEQIPAGELGIHRGATVQATDGAIGHGNEFIINPENNHISHLVLRTGYLWNRHEVTVPVAEIERIGTDTVYLKLNKHQVRALPDVPVGQ